MKVHLKSLNINSMPSCTPATVEISELKVVDDCITQQVGVVQGFLGL